MEQRKTFRLSAEAAAALENFREQNKKIKGHVWDRDQQKYIPDEKVLTENEAVNRILINFLKVESDLKETEDNLNGERELRDKAQGERNQMADLLISLGKLMDPGRENFKSQVYDRFKEMENRIKELEKTVEKLTATPAPSQVDPAGIPADPTPAAVESDIRIELPGSFPEKK